MKRCDYTRAAFIVFILIFVLIMSACQPTPENEIVVNKNDGAMEKEIKKEPTLQKSNWKMFRSNTRTR